MNKPVLLISGLSVLSAAVLCLQYEKGSLSFFHPEKKPMPGQKRIACVGDSITYGYGIPHWSRNHYPCILGKLLGDGYCVNNYGFSGRTVSPCGDLPYVGERLFRRSLEFQPDIVFLMLGTNDSKPYNWKGQGPFLQAYREIVRSYRETPSHPTVYILSPLPAFGAPVKFDINAITIAEDICPALKGLAGESDLTYIDLFRTFQGRPDLFPDGVHPNAAGARLIAETLFQQLHT